MALTTIQIVFKANINDMTDNETISMLEKWRDTSLVRSWNYDPETGMVTVYPLLSHMTPTLPEALHTDYNLYVKNHPIEPEMISIPKDEYIRLVAADKTIVDNERLLLITDHPMYDQILINMSVRLPDEEIFDWIEQHKIVAIEDYVVRPNKVQGYTVYLFLQTQITSTTEYARINNALTTDFHNFFNFF